MTFFDKYMNRFLFTTISLLIILLSFQTVYSDTIGHIRARSGSTSYNTFIWNGKFVKLQSGATCETTWIFDGKKLKNQCGAISYNTYLWNGKQFRPMSGATGRNTWIWNGTELKRQVGSTRNARRRFPRIA